MKQQVRGKPFPKGQSGNLSGQPAGSRNNTALLVEALMDGESEAVSRGAIAKALDGDILAIRLILDRIAPARKDLSVTFTMPAMKGPEDAVTAMNAILQAVAEGEVTPSEASELAKLVDTFVKVLEANELAQRLTAVERQLAA